MRSRTGPTRADICGETASSVMGYRPWLSWDCYSAACSLYIERKASTFAAYQPATSFMHGFSFCLPLSNINLDFCYLRGTLQLGSSKCRTIIRARKMSHELIIHLLFLYRCWGLIPPILVAFTLMETIGLRLFGMRLRTIYPNHQIPTHSCLKLVCLDPVSILPSITLLINTA